MFVPRGVNRHGTGKTSGVQSSSRRLDRRKLPNLEISWEAVVTIRAVAVGAEGDRAPAEVALGILPVRGSDFTGGAGLSWPVTPSDLAGMH